MDKKTFEKIIVGKCNAILINCSGKNEQVARHLRKKFLNALDTFIMSKYFKGKIVFKFIYIYILEVFQYFSFNA